MAGLKSEELRILAVRAYKAGMPQKVVASVFGIGVASLARWLRRERLTGSVAPLPHNGGPPPFVPDERLGEVKELVRLHPDATLARLAELFSAHFGISMKHTTVSKLLKKANISRKKNGLRG